MATVGADVLATRLRERIRDGTLPPGASLNQVGLAEEFGVSRIPLREALRRLQGEGLVVLDAGRGASVVEHTQADITDLYDLRLRLEPPLATTVIDRLAPADVRHLRQLAQQMDGSPDPEVWSDLNRRFHQAMYAHVTRRHTLRIVRQLIDLVEPYSHRYVHDLAGAGRASDEHLAMVDAIDGRDPDRLEELIREHLTGAREALLSALDGHDHSTTVRG